LKILKEKACALAII